MAARTLTQYLLDVNSEAAGHDYAHILSAVAVSAKLIAATVSRGPLILGQEPSAGSRDANSVNRSLRRQATGTLLDQTSGIGQLAAISIAGVPGIYPVSGGDQARYLLLVEALHGSRGLAENQTVGLAFSVLQRPATDQRCAAADFLQPGSRQLAAGMALFGPGTVLVVTTGDGVDGFTLDRDVGNFVLTHPRLTIPADAHSFAINPSDAPHWPAPVKRYVDECLQGGEGPRGHDFVVRWNASAVIGAFRILMNGGLFLAPDTGRRSGLWGLPLLHNAAPLAMVTEQAGGAATTGTQRVLDVVPGSLTHRVPMIFGAADEVARLERYFVDHERGRDVQPSYPLFHNRTLFAPEQ